MLAEKLRRLPHVTAASPSLYGSVFLVGPLQSDGAVLKGILVDSELEREGLARYMKEGSLGALKAADAAGGDRAGVQARRPDRACLPRALPG